MVTIKQKVWFIYFWACRGELRSFVPGKKKMVEHHTDFHFMEQHDGGSVYAELHLWFSVIWVLLLTLCDLQIHPYRTDPLMFWPKRRWLPRPPVEIRLQRRRLCRPPAARTRTLHSVRLGTTSSPRRDTWWWKFASWYFILFFAVQ